MAIGAITRRLTYIDNSFLTARLIHINGDFLSQDDRERLPRNASDNRRQSAARAQATSDCRFLSSFVA